MQMQTFKDNKAEYEKREGVQHYNFHFYFSYKKYAAKKVKCLSWAKLQRIS